MQQRTHQKPFLKQQGRCTDLELLEDTFDAATFLVTEAKAAISAVFESSKIEDSPQRRQWLKWSTKCQVFILENLPSAQKAMNTFIANGKRLLDIVETVQRAEASFGGLQADLEGLSLADEFDELNEYFWKGDPGGGLGWKPAAATSIRKLIEPVSELHQDLDDLMLGQYGKDIFRMVAEKKETHRANYFDADKLFSSGNDAFFQAGSMSAGLGFILTAKASRFRDDIRSQQQE